MVLAVEPDRLRRDVQTGFLKRGQSRDAERIITGSDGSAYYTADHYVSFVVIRNRR